MLNYGFHEAGRPNLKTQLTPFLPVGVKYLQKPLLAITKSTRDRLIYTCNSCQINSYTVFQM